MTMRRRDDAKKHLNLWAFRRRILINDVDTIPGNPGGQPFKDPQANTA
jgi:hypothetical protein